MHDCMPAAGPPLGVPPTSRIFKLPVGKIVHSGLDLSYSVENEWLCHLILKTYGVPVANAEIRSFDGVKVLVVGSASTGVGPGTAPGSSGCRRGGHVPGAGSPVGSLSTKAMAARGAKGS